MFYKVHLIVLALRTDMRTRKLLRQTLTTREGKMYKVFVTEKHRLLPHTPKTSVIEALTFPPMPLTLRIVCLFCHMGVPELHSVVRMRVPIRLNLYHTTTAMYDPCNLAGTHSTINMRSHLVTILHQTI